MSKAVRLARVPQTARLFNAWPALGWRAGLSNAAAAANQFAPLPMPQNRR